MTDTALPKIHETAIGATLLKQVDSLSAENIRLRTALADCANNVGAVASPVCTLEFLEIVPQEVRLVTERLRRERAEALLDAERAREERNRVHVELNAEWIRKTNALQAFHAFFADRCEGLFMQFGMPAVDAYSAVHMAARAAKEPT